MNSAPRLSLLGRRTTTSSKRSPSSGWPVGPAQRQAARAGALRMTRRLSNPRNNIVRVAYGPAAYLAGRSRANAVDETLALPTSPARSGADPGLQPAHPQHDRSMAIVLRRTVTDDGPEIFTEIDDLGAVVAGSRVTSGPGSPGPARPSGRGRGSLVVGLNSWRGAGRIRPSRSRSAGEERLATPSVRRVRGDAGGAHPGRPDDGAGRRKSDAPMRTRSPAAALGGVGRAQRLRPVPEAGCVGTPEYLGAPRGAAARRLHSNGRHGERRSAYWSPAGTGTAARRALRDAGMEE